MFVEGPQPTGGGGNVYGAMPSSAIGKESHRGQFKQFKMKMWTANEDKTKNCDGRYQLVCVFSTQFLNVQCWNCNRHSEKVILLCAIAHFLASPQTRSSFTCLSHLRFVFTLDSFWKLFSIFLHAQAKILHQGYIQELATLHQLPYD